MSVPQPAPSKASDQKNTSEKNQKRYLKDIEEWLKPFLKNLQQAEEVVPQTFEFNFHYQFVSYKEKDPIVILALKELQPYAHKIKSLVFTLPINLSKDAQQTLFDFLKKCAHVEELGFSWYKDNLDPTFNFKNEAQNFLTFLKEYLRTCFNVNKFKWGTNDLLRLKVDMYNPPDIESNDNLRGQVDFFNASFLQLLAQHPVIHLTLQIYSYENTATLNQLIHVLQESKILKKLDLSYSYVENLSLLFLALPKSVVEEFYFNNGHILSNSWEMNNYENGLFQFCYFLCQTGILKILQLRSIRCKDGVGYFILRESQMEFLLDWTPKPSAQSNLRSLELDDNEICDNALILMGICLNKFKQLEQLSLSSNPIREVGIDYIADHLLSGNTLQSISLALELDNKFTTEQLKIIDLSFVSLLESAKHLKEITLPTNLDCITNTLNSLKTNTTVQTLSFLYSENDLAIHINRREHFCTIHDQILEMLKANQSICTLNLCWAWSSHWYNCYINNANNANLTQNKISLRYHEVEYNELLQRNKQLRDLKIRTALCMGFHPRLGQDSALFNTVAKSAIGDRRAFLPIFEFLDCSQSRGSAQNSAASKMDLEEDQDGEVTLKDSNSSHTGSSSLISSSSTSSSSNSNSISNSSSNQNSSSNSNQTNNSNNSTRSTKRLRVEQ